MGQLEPQLVDSAVNRAGGMPISVLTQIGLGHFGLILVRPMWADTWTEMGTSSEPIGPKWFDRSGNYFSLLYHNMQAKPADNICGSKWTYVC